MPDVKAKVSELSLTNKAVESLFKNIMAEIDHSRKQIHELLEEVAFKDAYEKTMKKRKAPRIAKKVAASFSIFKKTKTTVMADDDNGTGSDSEDIMMSETTEEFKMETGSQSVD